jgi:hypothetical protein
VYKCKQADNTVVFQDTPCSTPGSTQQVVKVAESKSVLITALTDSFVAGLRVAAHKEEQAGRATSGFTTCMASADTSSIFSTLERLLSEKMNPAEIQAANTFFNGSAGKKFNKRGLMQVYQDNGEKPPEVPPTLTESENKDLNNFSTTSAGQKLIGQSVLSSIIKDPAVTALAKKIIESCAGKR